MKSKNYSLKFFIFIILFICLSISLLGQEIKDDEDIQTRSIISKDFKAKRTGSKSSTTRRIRKNRVTTNPNLRYHHKKRKTYSSKQITAKASKTSSRTKNKNGIIKTPLNKTEEFGVTFWRLRPLTDDERVDDYISTFPVLIDNKTGKREQWTAERVNSDTIFTMGDRVRFTFESTRRGYLYIINREFYTDGNYGEPSLIFPTLRIRGGNNSLRAGSLIEIPSAEDSIPYFTMRPKRDDYAGEELIVLITNKPIPDIDIQRNAQQITRQKIEDWLENWGSTFDIYDAEDGFGVAYSIEESQAANSTSRDLTQDEPLPQTIYRVKVREDLPIIIPLQMRTKDF